MRVKLEFNIPYDAFILIYKVDYSDKIICFIENRHITGLIIIVWNNEHDIIPNEHLVVLKFYQKIGSPIINSNELAQCLIIQQLDKDNYEIKTAQSTNVYIYNLNVYTIKEFVVYKGKLYLLKKHYTTELSYHLSNFD
jgi:hypothetical protein